MNATEANEPEQGTRDTESADEGAVQRAALVAELRARGKITTAVVKAAFRAVAREAFMPPGTELGIAYGYDSSVVTKRGADGAALSSVSAAYIQARMLEQAELRPGMTVLEIGSGGLNAAYIAEIVGERGRVVSVDIDPEVTDRAAKLLDETGYGSRVRVLVADAEQGVLGEGQFDAIIVTVGAWDIAPAWLRQLADHGVLVVPLVMNGVTRTIGFRRAGDHLVSSSVEVAGFVAMQGIGRHHEQRFTLTGPDGNDVTVRFDTDAPADPDGLDGVLATEPAEIWSGVTFPHQTSWADLYLWFAWYLPGFCRLSATDGSVLGRRGQWFPFGTMRGAGLAYLVIRPAMEGAGVEFGARAFGRDGEPVAAALVAQIRGWDRGNLRAVAPVFGYWPVGGDQSQIPDGAAVMAKTHGVVTISWPAEG
ncbi:hypothetical protein GCM10010112_82090 [Actinoplanes lobatus]|uniref:Protein-L-isoaspartate O-methyltransferase n=1 Tax=Actinoplanes lobatus TaxID=113568 RepID=A0A7W7HLB1_9ACTN|nr:methyltransferase, FxLD system [Actinoplanes lobatus]MBB4752623.1 protein-L-isoaspartate(D-aspartate) O-methyltransferase [Actinoplanes lobatus]GGN93637.1 hypothetical protein GCM10010112_82090 [Actinoplanes lobatus]GIE44712.1 hypothetical protein Alo02nite_76100 [Actinoplanes lobatus]